MMVHFSNGDALMDTARNVAVISGTRIVMVCAKEQKDEECIMEHTHKLKHKEFDLIGCLLVKKRIW